MINCRQIKQPETSFLNMAPIISGRISGQTCLITSLTNEELDAKNWKPINRAHWSIENGLHQRLDISRLDDLCRIRSMNGLLVHGMFARFANSLFAEWQSGWPTARQKSKTTTDFAADMGAEHCGRAMLTIFSKKPNLKPSS